MTSSERAHVIGRQTRRTALASLLFGAAATSLARPTAAGTSAGPAPTGAQPTATPSSQPPPSQTPPSQVPASQAPGACTLFPQAIEGPFYFDPKLVTPDIAGDRPGAATTLELRVIESGPCTPIRNARVDIWHADARGVYSGYDGQGDDGRVSAKSDTYLRGTQFSDADGRVTFNTIYPGWYPGRTPHMHIKIFLDATTLVTGQIYFPDAFSQSVYATREPYTVRPVADTTNARDFLFARGGIEGGGTVMAVATSDERIVAQLVIAVDRSGKAASAAPGVGGLFRRMLGQ